jgi:hypothetical protein
MCDLKRSKRGDRDDAAEEKTKKFFHKNPFASGES